MKYNSIWLNGVKTKECSSVENDLFFDVLIVGGGMTGISILYQLKDSNLNIGLVERNKVGEGVTSRTTGKLTYLQELIYSKIVKNNSLEVVKSYLKSQIDSINIVKNIVKENNIGCDFKEVDSYVFTNNKKEISNIRKERDILKKLNINVEEYSKIPYDIESLYAIKVSNTAIFHPLKYLNELKNICIKDNVSIYENSNLTKIVKEDEYYISTVNNKKIKSKIVVMATHYPYFLKPLLFPTKCYLEKSYIIAKEVDEVQNYSAITSNKPTYSIRYHEDKNKKYCLFLSGSHNICNNFDDKEKFKKLFNSNKNIEYAWSNKDIITFDNLPFIGSLNKDNTFLIATGYNTWGMTNGTIAGVIIKDIILNRENEYIKLFDPKRINMNLVLKYPINIMSSVKAIAKTKINKNKDWYSDNIKFIKKDGINLGIYIDELGNEHIIKNLCPHLKCSLIFNEVEKTWDCPCHGSRFDIDGKCIEGPSNYDIGFK